jgi:hypothetical protein
VFEGVVVRAHGNLDRLEEFMSVIAFTLTRPARPALPLRRQIDRGCRLARRRSVAIEPSVHLPRQTLRPKSVLSR